MAKLEGELNEISADSENVSAKIHPCPPPPVRICRPMKIVHAIFISHQTVHWMGER